MAEDRPSTISIHALREEGDVDLPAPERRSAQFLSTPSARRATGSRRCTCPSPRISIHALREEGDPSVLCGLSRTSYFYPRPPRGGRPRDGRVDPGEDVFLSTPSARRATRRPVRENNRDRISIHALREEGDGPVHLLRVGRVISIHALREEGDVASSSSTSVSKSFLSTPSARRATHR